MNDIADELEEYAEVLLQYDQLFNARRLMKQAADEIRLLRKGEMLDRLRARDKELRLILETILNGSGYPSYTIAERARALLASTDPPKETEG